MHRIDGTPGSVPSEPGRPAKRRILAAAASGVQDFIDRHGVDAQEVLSGAGLESAMLGNPRSALELGAYVEMMELAAGATGNDNFGLHFGHQFKPEMLGIIGEICLTSPDIGSAMANLAAFFPFHQQATETRLVQGPDLTRLEYRILDGSVLHRRQDAELTIGMFINVFRHCFGPSWSPDEIHCEHAKPADFREHERLYDAPFVFSQPTNAVLFRNRDLGRPMPGADMRRLWKLRNEISRLPGGVGAVSLLNRTKSEIRCRLPAAVATVGDVADVLGLQRWTFQRRLEEDGYSFSTLVEEVRRELALVYVQSRHIAITEIAFALGYSEPSALSRAFRRWYGVSPQQFRVSRSLGGR